MPQQRTNSSNVRSLRRTQQCVLAQCCPKASALMLKVRYGAERGGTPNFPFRKFTSHRTPIAMIFPVRETLLAFRPWTDNNFPIRKL
jgi:hypothetical protein